MTARFSSSRAAVETADHEPEAARRPEQPIAERTAVERPLGQEDLGDVDQPAGEHREPERDEHGDHRGGVLEDAEPFAEVPPVPTADRLLALQQLRRDAEQQKR